MTATGLPGHALLRTYTRSNGAPVRVYIDAMNREVTVLVDDEVEQRIAVSGLAQGNRVAAQLEEDDDPGEDLRRQCERAEAWSE